MVRGHYEQREYIARLFGGFPGIYDSDFMSFIADIFSAGVQSGRRTEMCDFIANPIWERIEVQMLAKLAEKFELNVNDYDRYRLKNTTINYNKNIR